MAERTTIRLPEELLRRAKRKAAAEGRTLTSLIEDGLRLVVAERKIPAKSDRVMPRISTARGEGFVPKIDPADMSAIQELDDLEYVARMRRFK